MDFELTAAQQGDRAPGPRALRKNSTTNIGARKTPRQNFLTTFMPRLPKPATSASLSRKPYGGSGLGITEAALVMKEIAGSGGAMAAASSVHLSIFGVSPIVFHGTEEQKQRFLPPIVRGEIHAAFAVTEPDAGNDITHIKTAARREGDYYVINGRKVFTTKAREAKRMLILTRTTPFENVKKKTDGMSLFFAELDPAAVEVREPP